MTGLFDPMALGPLDLANRVVMAPMTRTRAPEQIAGSTVALYYAQRATAGLIVTEGTFISPSARGFAAVPGIWRNDQVDGWESVTRSVHQAGGRIIAQLWHVGRVSHVELQPDGAPPLSSTSHRTESGRAYIYDSTGHPKFQPCSDPVGMDLDQIAQVIADFARAARNAMDAGFDGVEIHGANGYLLEQFINPAVNDRSDEYHAYTVDNRLRFPLEVVGAVADAIGAERTGLRLSPWGTASGMPHYPDIAETYEELGRRLDPRLLYVHLNDQHADGRGEHPGIPWEWIHRFRGNWSGPVILTGGMTGERARLALDAGVADLIGFGRPFISNPDLVRRLRGGAELTPVRQELVYAQSAEGYVDYPGLA